MPLLLHLEAPLISKTGLLILTLRKLVSQGAKIARCMKDSMMPTRLLGAMSESKYKTFWLCTEEPRFMWLDFLWEELLLQSLPSTWRRQTLKLTNSTLLDSLESEMKHLPFSSTRAFRNTTGWSTTRTSPCTFLPKCQCLMLTSPTKSGTMRAWKITRSARPRNSHVQNRYCPTNGVERTMTSMSTCPCPHRTHRLKKLPKTCNPNSDECRTNSKLKNIIV